MIKDRIYQSRRFTLQRFFVFISLLALISLVVMFKQSEILAEVRGAEQRGETKKSHYERREHSNDPEPRHDEGKVSSQGYLRNTPNTEASSPSRSHRPFSNPHRSTPTLVLSQPCCRLRSTSSLTSSMTSSTSGVPSSLLLVTSALTSSMPSSRSVVSSSSPQLVTKLTTSSSSSSSLRSPLPVCSYEGLGDRQNVQEPNMSCIPHPRNDEYCKEAFQYFGNYSLESEASKCNATGAPGAVCMFITEYRLSRKDQVKVKCERNICEGNFPVYLGCPDPNYGVLRNSTEWLKFPSIQKLERELPNIVVKSAIHGFNFCFVRCTRNGNDITQSLIFPPLIKRRSNLMDGDKISVNILLEDSISRLQFYRYLPHTVRALREIARKQEATVLDFELVQSYASFTVPNVQHFMAGTKYQRRKIRHNGIEVLTQKFKSLGYQTLFHEDLCWFDFWGALLSPTYKKKLEYFTEEFQQEYLKYLQSTEPHIDNPGMTAFACEVLRALGQTNPFKGDRLPKLCWNGRFLSDYVLTYVRGFLSAIERNPSAMAPALIYTHLNTAHEGTGMRVRDDDSVLSQFVTEMAQRQNTLTIVLSDHGAKTNDYAIKSFAGSMEVYNPMLFMVVPHEVAQKLGKRRMEALRANQRRLVSVLDLHRMLMSLGNLPRSTRDQHNHLVSGLLSPVPLNRTCADVEGLAPDALCLCQGWHKWLSSSSLAVVWLSEFALGELNNMIQKQFSEGTAGQRRGRAYGACARLVGKHVERARQELVGKDYVVTMVLVVVPEYSARSAERFEVQLRYAPVREHNITFVKFTRLSVYSKFEACRDGGVDVTLCACSGRASLKPLNITNVIRRKSFKRQTTVKALDSSQSCLFLATRKLNAKVLSEPQARVLAFEVANVCEHKEFAINVGGVHRMARISRALPFSLHVKPASVYFLFSVLNDWKYGRFRPIITVQQFVSYPKG